MNFQITRIRLASVGPEPARYDPLDLDLTSADGTGPLDTVLFLPNTGGKTVLLRLIFSVLHPPIVERIGSEEVAGRSRNLPGYVLERDTAHVVVEWRRAEGGRFVDDEVLITGLVAEWRGGRPTGNPADLVRLWYTIRGPADIVGADRLEFEAKVAGGDGLVRRRLPLRRFREQLAELGKTERRDVPTVTMTETQREWIEHLDALGLDRALFRYQAEMNHNEAGASAIARFTRDLDFVEFFLNAVMDPAELMVLDREFEEVADKVRRYPEYERRLRFEEATLSQLQPLVAEVEAATSARSEADSARHAALALLGAFAAREAAARERQRVERERYRERDADARRLAAAADRLRDEWREFRRIAAAMSLDEANDAYAAAQVRTATAELDVRAWSIVEDLVRHREAAAEVRVLDEIYAAELKRLRPLQEARDQAGRALARRLAADAVLADAEVSSQRERAAAAKQRAAALRQEERDALIEAAKLDTARAANERRSADVAARRESLVANGYVEAGERTEDARDREAAGARKALARIEAIEVETAALHAERAVLDDADRAAAPRAIEIRRDHDRLADDIQRAETERERLAAEPLAIELAEADTFDLELVGPAIAQRLLGRADEADKARIDLQLQGLDDRRALRSLDEDGLLPPPPDVEAALARLAAAGIVGAMPGTRYVAEAVSAVQRTDVVARRADLVGGIVLTNASDLVKARSILEAASLDPLMIVAVGPASDLVEADAELASRSTFVVPPADAVWDRTASGAERARRESRMASLQADQDALDTRAKGARRLADALARHAVAYPVGSLAARIAERDTLAGDLARLERERADRDSRRRENATAVCVLQKEASELRKTAREAERRAVELGRLAEEEAATADLAAAIDRQRAEADDWRSAAKDAARIAGLADNEAEEASQAAHDQRAAADRLRRELAGIALAEPVADLSAAEAKEIVAAGDDRSELRARFAELDRRLTGEASSSEITARRAAALRTRDALRATIDTHPANVRDRASLFVTLPESSDLAGRRAAAERVDVEVESARAAEREAYAAREQARKELDVIDEEIRSSRRPVKIAHESMPRDRHHAARLAAQARQSAEINQSQVADAERDRTAARDAADAAKALAEALATLATPLRMALNLPDDERLPAVDAYEGDAEAARATGLETSRRLTDAAAAVDRADRAMRARDTAVRALLAREEFADLAASDRLYRRLARSPTETLANDASDLVAELRASIGVLHTELATLSEDVKLATTSLAKSVNKAMSFLKLGEARSKMPASLRDWAGEPFLVIRFEKPPAEEIEGRLKTFVAGIVNRPSNRPAGSTLLLQALEHAVGEFAVRILKPNEAFAPIRVPVTDLSSPTFSNGQRSTVATALMLMLSELRRQSRSVARGASVGALMLDNPFGNANAGFLIEVQRTVAAAAGIQLIYMTGIADLSALRHFPNVIALSNDAARRTMRKYVRANPALLELLVPSDDGRGGRLSATRVVAINSRGADVRA